MNKYNTIINPITGYLQLISKGSILFFKNNVTNYSSLPISGNKLNDARFANDTGILYVWSIDSSSGVLTNWEDQENVINEHTHSNLTLLDTIDHLPIDGKDGAKGDKGDAGEQGIQGLKGDKGDKGDGGGGFLSKCRVYFDGTQNFTIGTPKKVIFNYINFDVNSEWDVTNNRFIVKESGYYLMIGQLQWANYKSKAGSMMFYRNYGLPGADALLIIMGSDTISGVYVNGSTINYLNANDYIEVWGLASNAVSYGGSSTMFFAIHRLS